MKNFTMRLTFAVATLAAAALSASAQTYKADVPMAFSAGGKRMPAGTYAFVVSTGATVHPVVTVRNQASSQAAVIMALPGSDAPKAWRDAATPKIGFECAAGACSLAKLYDGRDISAMKFATPKVSPAQKERMASITLSLARTE